MAPVSASLSVVVGEQRAPLPRRSMVFLFAGNRTFWRMYVSFVFQHRRGHLKAQEKSSVHLGAGVSQANDFPVQFTQENFTKSPTPIPTSPALWPSRKCPPSLEAINEHQRKLGNLRWLATVSRQGARARLARVAARVSSVPSRKRKRSANMEHSPSHRIKPERGDVDGRTGAQGGKEQRGTTLLAGWPDAAYGAQTSERLPRLPNVF